MPRSPPLPALRRGRCRGPGDPGRKRADFSANGRAAIAATGRWRMREDQAWSRSAVPCPCDDTEGRPRRGRRLWIPVRLTHTRVNDGRAERLPGRQDAGRGARKAAGGVRRGALFASGTLRYLRTRNRPATRVGRHPRLPPFRYGRGAGVPGGPERSGPTSPPEVYRRARSRCAVVVASGVDIGSGINECLDDCWIVVASCRMVKGS